MHYNSDRRDDRKPHEAFVGLGTSARCIMEKNITHRRRRRRGHDRGTWLLLILLLSLLKLLFFLFGYYAKTTRHRID